MTVRTELDVAARVVVALIDAGLVPANPKAIAKASEELGVPVALIRLAWQRWDVDPWVPPAATPVSAPPPVRNEQRNRTVESVRRWRAKNPQPGRRRCVSCGQLKPSSDFPVKDQATQQLRSDCRPCWLERQRSRYLSVRHDQALAAARLEFTLLDGDGAVGLRCLVCKEPLEAGQYVVGAAVLAHAHHSDAELRSVFRAPALDPGDKQR